MKGFHSLSKLSKPHLKFNIVYGRPNLMMLVQHRWQLLLHAINAQGRCSAGHFLLCMVFVTSLVTLGLLVQVRCRTDRPSARCCKDRLQVSIPCATIQPSRTKCAGHQAVRSATRSVSVICVLLRVCHTFRDTGATLPKALPDLRHRMKMN